MLDNNQVVMHPYLVAELALGSLHDGLLTLAKLDNMPKAPVVDLREVRRMVEARGLFSKRIGLTDARLVASCLVRSGTLPWTTDVRLGKVADSLGVRARLP